MTRTTDESRADALTDQRIEAAAIAMHELRRDLAKGVGDQSFDMAFDALPNEIKDVDRALARAAILAAPPVEQHEAAPAGWMLVPVKITDAMIESALEHHYGKRRVRQSGGAAGVVMTVNDHDWSGIDAMRRFWKGALAAAPQPAAQPEPPTQPAPSAPLEGTGNGAVPALTDQQWEELRLIARTYNERGFPKHAHWFFAHALSVEVAGAVLTDDARECLMDVVSHCRGLSTGLAYMLNQACVDKKPDDEAYWKHEIKALDRMLAQAERALAGPSADAAAAPADERPKPSLIASAKTINAVSAALDAVREYANSRVADQMNRAVNMLLDELGQARAAASQPAAAAAWETTHPAVCTPITKEPLVAAGWREQGWHVAPLYTAPPAKVATRQELTDDAILDEYSKYVHTTYAGGVNVLSAMQPEGFIKAVRTLLDNDRT